MSNLTKNVKTATKSGIEVILSAKNGKVWAVVNTAKIQIDAEVTDGYGGQSA